MAAAYKDVAQVIALKLEAGNASANDIAAYLVDAQQTAELDKIMREVEKLRFENRNIVEVTVSSAYKLTESTITNIKDMLKTRFQAEEVVVVEKINKDLVGGVKIQALDTEIDLSVRGQLNQLRSHKF